jgi:hypothetical protein
VEDLSSAMLETGDICTLLSCRGVTDIAIAVSATKLSVLSTHHGSDASGPETSSSNPR